MVSDMALGLILVIKFRSVAPRSWCLLTPHAVQHHALTEKGQSASLLGLYCIPKRAELLPAAIAAGSNSSRLTYTVAVYAGFSS